MQCKRTPEHGKGKTETSRPNNKKQFKRRQQGQGQRRWWIYSLTLIISYSDTVQYKIKNLTYVCGFLFTVQRMFVKYFIKATESSFSALT